MSRFKKVTRFNKSLIGAFVGFFLFAGMAFVSAEFYYRFMPGKWFINYYQVQPENTTVGSDVKVRVCRKVRGTNLRINATRIYFMRDDGGRFNSVGDYEYTAIVENLDNTDCQDIKIKAKDHPTEIGTYKFTTEADFFIEGKRKSLRYESSTYELTHGAPVSLPDSPNLDATTTQPLTPVKP